MRLALPRLWYRLFAGIGPVIGIVVIQKELETEILGMPGQGDGVLQIVRQVRGSVKQTQANPVVAVISQNLQARLGFVSVLENYPLLLSLCEKGDIGADRIVLTVARLRYRNHRAEQQRQHSSRV